MTLALLLACTREGVCDDLVTTYESLFNDHVDITVPGYTSGTNVSSNFTLLVRLSESKPSGFKYSRVDSYGADLRFLYHYKTNDVSVVEAVPHEVDEWNTSGESLVWVRLPRLNNNTAEYYLTMYWAPDDAKTLPANVARQVWSDCIGVWHLNSSSDSSPNALPGTLGSKALSMSGIVGNAYGTRVSGAYGSILSVPYTAALDSLSGGYSVTAWVRLDSITGETPYFYSRRQDSTTDALGAQFVEYGDEAKLKLWCNGTDSLLSSSTKSMPTNTWSHLMVSVAGDGGKHVIYLNGEELYKSESSHPETTGSLGFSIGGLLGTSEAGTFHGVIDEFRVFKTALPQAWAKQDYAQVALTDYVMFGTVSSTGKDVYQNEKTAGDDPAPGAIEDVSPADYAGTAVFTPAELPSGAALTNFVMEVKVWEGEPAGFIPSDLPFGTEDIRFFDEQGRVLDYEVDTWDVNGECFFWVKLPLLNASTRVTMCWGLREGRTLPSNDPGEVWSDYAGVWHMTDATDSTTNAAEGAFCSGVVSNPLGVTGAAAGKLASGDRDPILEVASNAAIDALTDSSFTVSGWVYLNTTNVHAGALYSRGTTADPAWGAQFCGPENGDSSLLEVAAGDGSTVTGTVRIAKQRWTRFDVVYAADRVALYVNGVQKVESVQARTIQGGSTGRLAVGGIISLVEEALGPYSLNGYIDEFRLRAGVQTESEREAEYGQGSNEDYFTRQAASWDESAVIQNRWRVYPTISKTEWNLGEESATVTLGEPWYGVSSVSYLNRLTGAVLSEMPTEGGDYRAVFYCPPVEQSYSTRTNHYSSLTYTIDFRVRLYKPSHDLGDENDRILILSDDGSVSGGEVWDQSYGATATGFDRPYWVHDVDSGLDYTSTSPYYNFCGGMRHTYWSRGGETRLWDLIDVRYGNTYNNADEVFRQTYDWEEWDDGLSPEMNYLPWNPDGGCLVDLTGLPADGWHEFAAQAVMCNSESASINSTLYTNGIGTIYFDAVNADIADATNDCCKLVVEFATNALTRAEDPADRVPYGIPTDDNIEATHVEWSESEGKYVLVVHDPYKFADWKRLDMHVMVVNGSTMTDLGTTDELTLRLAGGGSYTNFYRIYIPVDCLATARFRIRRTATNPDYTMKTDVRSLILVDNVICSKPTDRVRIEPRGTYDTAKVKRETVGYEGAFKPAYPSVSDDEVYARAKATTLSGATPPEGMVSSVSIHYRWRYLDQQSTEWMTADLNPLTMVGTTPLALPGISGDIEYWYQANQSGEFYQFADYSGLNLGIEGYSEEVSAVTNRAETYETKGKDWFTRIRDGHSDCGTVRLFVRRGEDGPVETVQMFVARDQVWRGCLMTTNAVEDGIYYRFEVHNRQDDSQDDFQFNTNCWYSVDESETLPVSGTVRVGTTNDWGVVPCDAATGHILFQLDDTTRALTVVHADWQDFNAWNDAHEQGPKPYYFVGTSTDDTTKKGTSATRREYPCSCDRWDEDVATNEVWRETFEQDAGWNYEMYSPFVSDTTHNGSGVGYGMYVCGAYRNVTENMALQMAGQGQGYVQMVNPLKDPRGLETVKFSARIAQAISPDDFAYYEDGVSLNDYTFLTRAAFDLGGNSNFTGNASLSLAAFYRAHTSCYEARWEQLSGNVEDGSGTILGPSPRGQRLALYRWNFKGNEWSATELYAATNSGSVYSWRQKCSPTAIPATFSITNHLMPFALGAYNDKTKNETLVIAAVLIPGGNKYPAQNVAGISANAEISYLNSQYGWLYLVYRDTSSERLTRGSYGVLSANCEGVFVRPQIHSKIASWLSEKDTKNLQTKIYPSESDTKVPDTGAQAKFTADNVDECVDDMVEGYWIVPDGRMESFVGDTTDEDDHCNGFEASVVTQSVDIYTAELHSTSWPGEPLASCEVTDFGRPGVLHNFEIDFWSTDDSSVQLRAGGHWDRGVRTDVVVDLFEISQWRGKDSYDPTDDDFDVIDFRTNFVYTSGWMTDGALQLSPRRTPDGEPCSLRAPLCDGKGSGKALRGLGLGHISFKYRNAQTNACLLIQIATNNVAEGTLESLTQDPGTDSSNWTTITNFDFSAMTEEERASGVLSCSPGIHGVKGVLRIIVDPTLRARVKDVTDPTAFGSVEIVSALFRDEPPLDKGSWWGWNLRTLGDITDEEQRMYLPDNPYRSLDPQLDEIGRSLALNNSITENCDPTELAKESNPYNEHMPFLQTPTFASNIVGEVSFKARKYSLLKGAQCAEVTLYGAKTVDVDSLDDKDWELLNIFIISNSTYESYRYKTDSSAGYRAFRFAVTGVRGVLYPGPSPICGDEPVRVLLDDVLVSEAVRARLAFRNVGAFRNDISKTTYVTNVPSASEQPIVGEGWGVQAEVYPAMLGEEIDETVPPRVRLHYYKGLSPWGYENWKSKATSAWLTRASDTNRFYRSSAEDSPDAVIPMASKPEVVQYMLEVIYTIVNSETGGRTLATNFLESVDWPTPSWYHPVDYNASLGHGQADSFAAFSLIDTIGPGWAWINEMNIFGSFNSRFENSDKARQFVEIVKPVDYDLKGWTLRMLEAKTPGAANSAILTNDVAVFGQSVSAQKAGTARCSFMSFIVVGNPTTSLSREDGEYDGAWSFPNVDNKAFKWNSSTKNYWLETYFPVAVQLIRPSGVIEHEIALLGTNQVSSVQTAVGWQYDSTNLVRHVRNADSDSRVFALPDDNYSAATSVGVFTSQGESAACWNNTMKLTPGDLNENQTIEPLYPTPLGELIMVFASVNTSFGHIVQTVGAVTNSTVTQTLTLKRGSSTGVDIKYVVDPWYELGAVKEVEDGAARIPIITTNSVRHYTVNVAKEATHNVTVVASAAVDRRLREFGLDENNRYTPAVLRWLENHKDAFGNDFYDWESGDIQLAKFLALSGNVVTNMTLTQMYWLDMDPTAGEMYFRAGMVRPPSQEVVDRPTYKPGEPEAYTNLRVGVYMSISNGNDRVKRDEKSVWAPYVLRGLAPDELSWDYEPSSSSPNNWTSETFRVTGFMNNGETRMSDPAAWVALRYFVFHEDSFDSNFETLIDVADPYSTKSPAYAQGWGRWVAEHGWKPGVSLSWDINDILKPVTAEVLAPTNRLDTTP